MRLMSKNTIKFTPTRYSKTELHKAIINQGSMSHYVSPVKSRNLITKK